MAVTEYYVSPGSGNDTTGDGSISTPWATVQKALNTITRDATDGDRINVQAGTADVLGATLDYTLYGTPTAVVQLTIQGYTTTAGDGGIGVIDGGAGNFTICTGWTYANFIDMKVGNCGTADVLDFGTGGNAVNCEIHTSSGFGVDCGSNSIVLGCWLHTLTGTQAIDNGTGTRVLYCFIDCAVTTSVIDGGAYSVIIGNIIDLSGANLTVIGINVNGTNQTVIGNTVYCSNANSLQGILVAAAGGVALNNIVEGWSGAGGDGIEASNYAFVGANAVHNCTAAYTFTAEKLNYAIAPNDTIASASPLTDAANDDFSIKDAITGVTEDAYPASFRGL